MQKKKRELGNESTLTNNDMGNTGGLTYAPCGDYDPSADAEALRDAMEENCFFSLAPCTDEDAIWRTLEPLTCWQRNCVRATFNQLYGDGGTLFEWFEGDLSGALLSRAKNYFNCVEEPLEIID